MVFSIRTVRCTLVMLLVSLLMALYIRLYSTDNGVYGPAADLNVPHSPISQSLLDAYSQQQAEQDSAEQ